MHTFNKYGDSNRFKKNLLIFFPLITKTEIAYLQELNESLKDRFDVKSSYKSLHNKYLNMQKDEREQNEKVLWKPNKCDFYFVHMLSSRSHTHTRSTIKVANSTLANWSTKAKSCAKNIRAFNIKSSTLNGT